MLVCRLLDEGKFRGTHKRNKNPTNKKRKKREKGSMLIDNTIYEIDESEN